MDHQALRMARANWYGAYLAGDVERLTRLEDKDFFVVSELGIESCSSRLKGIASCVAAGRWFPVGSQVVDEQLELRDVSEDLVSVVGIGRISTPKGGHPVVLFTELWKRVDEDWQVLHLHYHGRGA